MYKRSLLYLLLRTPINIENEIGIFFAIVEFINFHQVITLITLSCRLIHVPGCIIAGLVGLIVDVPLFAAIAIIKSPYMLFKGWYRLLHDLIGREGPFLETACIPIAGLTILLWPLVVVGSILVTIFSSIFIGLYASVILYQVGS